MSPLTLCCRILLAQTAFRLFDHCFAPCMYAVSRLEMKAFHPEEETDRCRLRDEQQQLPPFSHQMVIWNRQN